MCISINKFSFLEGVIVLAFMEKLIGKRDELDIEDFLNNLDTEEENPYEDAEAFVKPITLQTEHDKDVVLEEAKKGNILLINIADLSKRNAMKLKELVTAIRAGIEDIDGDVARISQDRIIVTPAKVKIIKRKEE
ncbi:MAG TPA: cell division protein SepF [archaeon]|nr:cell division protein SepF [archaeon]